MLSSAADSQQERDPDTRMQVEDNFCFFVEHE